MFYDSTILLVIPGLLLALWAQASVRHTYKKYSKVLNSRGLRAENAVESLLLDSGNSTVTIKPIEGEMTDHYDPSSNSLSLSEGVYGSSSVAAIAIAAHEAGHAMQQHTGYKPLVLRSAAVPSVNIGSSLSIPMFILGMVFSIKPLITFGIVLFSLSVAFALITLPVEIDASNRAMQMIQRAGILNAEEERGARRVLRAAAMTYVAAAVGAVLQLLRLLILSRSSNRD